MLDLKEIDGLEENERVEGDMVYCTLCGGEKLEFLDWIDGTRKVFRKMCKCQKEEHDKQECERKRLQRIADIKKNSMIPIRYRSVRFSNTSTGSNQTFDQAYKRCKGYCEQSEKVLKNGWGIYLQGDKGTGKTHIAACIANELIEQCYEVLFTNFFEITKEIKATYNSSSDVSEIDLIEKIATIDDIGTETMKKNGEDTWIQEKIYDVLNKRYNENKPTIFTSNNSLPELVNERGMMDKTVDRIMEMATVILKFEGQSFRREMRKVALPF